MMNGLRSIGEQKESNPDVGGARWMFDLFQDLRYALRTLFRRPGFAVVALLTLGLGIGITTVMFTIANSVLLKPLPYRDPDRLVSLHERLAGHWFSLSYLNYQDVRRGSRTLGPMAAWRFSGGIVSAPGTAEHVEGRLISAGLFALYGVPLPHGREFLTEEDRTGGSPVAIIGQNLWRSRYQGDPSAVGQQLVLNGKSYTVIGIAPQDFRLGFDDDIDVYIPLGQDTGESIRNREIHHQMGVLARVHPGVSMEQVRGELESISRQLTESYPKINAGLAFKAVPLQSELVENVQSKLWLLFGAVVLVLMIGCANLASLLLVRAAAREREVSMRMALGAGRGRLIRQCLAESMVIALLGGMLGVALASLGIQPFLAMWPEGLPRVEEIRLDWQVLLFALAVSLMSSLIFGLAPALRAPRHALERSIHASSRTISGRSRFHAAFIAGEIAITIVLLVAAGMLGRELLRFSRLDPGINAHNVLIARLSLSPTIQAEPARLRTVCREIMDGLRNTPGVESAGLTDVIPMSGGNGTIGYWTGTAQPPMGKMPISLMYTSSPSQLKVMGISLRRGRFFTEQDRLDSERVIVIDEMLAKRAFPGQDAVGQQLSLQVLGPARIVGVVGHVRHFGLVRDDSAEVREQLYFPLAQIPDQFMGVVASNLSLAVRTSVPPMRVLEAVQREIRGLANDQAMYGVRTMEMIMRDTLAEQRFLLILFGVFAGLALLLASIGIYGVISYLTGQRMQEFGVRMALGARAGDVVHLALKQGIWMIAVGVLVGSAASVLAGRALAAATEVPAHDPLTFVCMVALLVMIALLASFVPARRAGKADPATVLRQE